MSHRTTRPTAPRRTHSGGPPRLPAGPCPWRRRRRSTAPRTGGTRPRRHRLRGVGQSRTGIPGQSARHRGRRSTRPRRHRRQRCGQPRRVPPPFPHRRDRRAESRTHRSPGTGRRRTKDNSAPFLIGSQVAGRKRDRPLASPAMVVIDDLSHCPHPLAGTVLTIGAYDGVHLGHRMLIAQVRDAWPSADAPAPSSPSTATRRSWSGRSRRRSCSPISRPSSTSSSRPASTTPSSSRSTRPVRRSRPPTSCVTCWSSASTPRW